MPMQFSIVIPVYRSELTIGKLIDQLEASYASKAAFEIILVNDGSPDNSLEALRKLSRSYDNITVINLSKNFGQHNAIMAGFHYATGDYIITMDDDLQHAVEEIDKLIAKINEGYDVVYGQYVQKNHSLLKNLGSEINNIMADTLIKKPKWLRFTSFRIIRSYVVKELIKYDAPYPYIDGLLLRVTANIGVVQVKHNQRIAGKSSYTLKKLINLWLNGFLNFSIMPLRLFSYIGMICASIGFLAALAILVRSLLFYSPIQGWTSLIVSTLIFSGIQLLSIGMVGEYIGRIFLTQNMTPQYVTKELIMKGTAGKYVEESIKVRIKN